MDTLQDLARAFLASTDALEKEHIRERVCKLLYGGGTLDLMIVAMLLRIGRSIERLSDTRQEVVATFVLSVLPRIENPDAAWGAVTGTIETLGKRLGSAKGMYDFERVFHTSLNEPTKHEHAEDEDSEIYLANAISSDEKSTDGEWGEIADKIASTNAKAAVLKALLNSNMQGKSPVKWLSQALSQSSVSRKPPKLSEMPVLPRRRRRATNISPEAPPDYNRLVEIRELTGVTVEEYAKHLNIQPAALISYLQRKVNVPPLVLKRAEQWFERKGHERAARVKELTAIALPELLSQWLEATGAKTYAALADIIDVSVPTITRWNKRPATDTEVPTRPMHVSHLLQCEDKVLRYCRANARKLERRQSRSAKS